MSQIHKKLSEWKDQNLISQNQLDGIVSYEASLPKTNWSQIGFVILGAGTIALGIISLIAYNWALIPNGVKLTVGFAILLGIAGGIYWPRFRNSVVVQNGLISLFALHCFAMIGLIAQIYNLSGPAYQTGLFWSAITLLLVTYATHFLVPAFWTFVFTLSLYWGCLEWEPLKSHITTPSNFFVLFLTVIALGGRSLFKNVTLQKWIEFSAIICGVLAMLCGSIRFGVYMPGDTEPITKIIPHFALGLVALSLLQFDKSFKKIVKTMFLLLVCLVLFDTVLDAFAKDLKLLPTLIGIVGLLAWALSFYAENYRKAFNFMMVLIAIKIFEIFVQNASGLIATGVGLVSGGLVVILAVYAWNKKKDILEQRLQEFIK